MADVKKRIKNKTKPESIKKNADTVSAERSSTTRGLPLRVLSRAVVIISLLIIVYFSYQDNVRSFAKQSEILPGKGQIVECSSDYDNELHKFEGCAPKECKRFVTDKVISIREVEGLLEIARKGLKYGGSPGGASIIDLHSGAMSVGQHFVNIYEVEDMKNLYTEEDFNLVRIVRDKVKYSISHHFGVQPDKIYSTYPTFISEISLQKAITNHDKYWHPHVDKVSYKSFDYTALLYLSDYGIDFEGGRFVFIDDKFNSTIEPRKARLSMFTSGAENTHYVEKITSGIRYAMTIPFTCNKKFAIKDPSTNKYNKMHSK